MSEPLWQPNLMQLNERYTAMTSGTLLELESGYKALQ